MPNIISVTNRGPDILSRGVEAAGLDVGEAFKDAKSTYGEIRKAGQLLKAHPLGAVVADLVFPKPVADGTLDGARELGAITRYEQGY